MTILSLRHFISKAMESVPLKSLKTNCVHLSYRVIIAVTDRHVQLLATIGCRFLEFIIATQKMCHFQKLLRTYIRSL